LGRIAKLHPGKDGHTRVVTLQTAKGEIKRPITKLVPLVEENENQRNTNDKNLPKNRPKKLTWTSLICYTLMFIMTLITPTVQQENLKVAQLTKNQTIYFDKIANLQEIRGEWKLVFYYNMTNYWRNVEALQEFILHLREFQKDDWLMQFQILTNQLEQNTHELNYYNNLLTSNNIIQHRFKRGLIDGVGYVANSLFGILDQRFADKYEQDINLITHNEIHLWKLIKNQTSILETEQNIIQRNEATMVNHLNLINDHLSTLKNTVNKEKIDSEKAFYILTSTIAAETVVQNLKTIQQNIINTLTNMYRGHMDVHLLSPTQIKGELDKIARQLPRDSLLPEVQKDVRDIYSLFRIHARITRQYLLMEIKIPILLDTLYEVNKLISIPQHVDSNQVMYVIPNSNLIAFNTNENSFISLDQSDIQDCIKYQDATLMCKLNHPIYTTGDRRKSICDIQLIRDNEQHRLYCHTEIKACSDRWVKLHKQNTWFYYCCSTCDVQIICGNEMSLETLPRTGLLSLKRGCKLQGNGFTLYANWQYTSDILISNPNDLVMPTISPINNIINTSISNLTLHVVTNEETFKRIDTELQTIKEQSKLETVSSHDYHHYIMIYGIIIITSLLCIISICYWKKITVNRQTRDVQSRPNQDTEDGYSTITKQDTKVKCKVNKAISVNPSKSEVKFGTDKHDDVCATTM